VKKTRICELLGIEYPIIQGGMAWISGAELAASVSNAGGLGTITSAIGKGTDQSRWPQNLKEQIREVRNLTDKPFAVNISLASRVLRELIAVVLDEGVGIVVTTAGSPKLYTRRLKEAGLKVMHPVFSARQAAAAETEGVDVVIASGYEGGGEISRNEVTTMVLIPQVVDRVKVPVVAAGGIADARGFVAAIALGADGIQMGTRFIATTESLAHPNYKEAIVRAMAADITVSGRKSEVMMRALKNDFTREILRMEAKGLSKEEMLDFIGAGRMQRAAIQGDMEGGTVLCGSVAELVGDIVSAAEVIERMVKGYDQVVSRLA
jgi:putative enoyl-[acyl-carrier-protein] reductase II